MKRAASLVADVSDLNSFICGIVLLGDCVARKEDVQKASSELLRCFHALIESNPENRKQQSVVLATVLQKLVLYARQHGLSARVHVGSGCPLSAIVQVEDKTSFCLFSCVNNETTKSFGSMNMLLLCSRPLLNLSLSCVFSKTLTLPSILPILLSRRGFSIKARKPM
jgi:hypothetical protein